MKPAGLLLAAALLGGCGGGTPATTAPVAPAVHAPICFTTCRSPDGAWAVEFAWRPARLILIRRSTGKRFVGYQSIDACCSDVTWARPHLLVFDDDYRLITLDPVTRKTALIADFSDFVVSPDGRWLAGYAAAGPREPQPVGAISLATSRCFALPGADGTPEGFTRDSEAVIVDVGNGRSVEYPVASLKTPCTF